MCGCGTVVKRWTGDREFASSANILLCDNLGQAVYVALPSASEFKGECNLEKYMA